MNQRINEIMNLGNQNQKLMANAIIDRDNFINLIELERDRVHRTNRQFSLVLISVNGNNNGSVDISDVTKIISKRVRRIDRIGWYDDTHLGVLLPNTNYTGAQVFLKDIKITKAETNRNMDMVIISYPENS